MINRKLLVVSYFLILINNATIYASDSSNMPTLPSYSNLLPYTNPPLAPADIPSFINNQANACGGASESRDRCFVQYTVSGSSGNYTLQNSSLQCPPNYIALSLAGDTIYNITDPSSPVYHYAAVYYPKLTQVEYNNIVGTPNTTCSPNTSLGNVYSLHSFQGTSLDCCGGDYNSPSGAYETYMDPNNFPTNTTSADGYYLVKSGGYSSDGDQDTTECGYAEACEHYTASGCPNWCAHKNFYSQQYSYIQCTRTAGFSVVGTNAVGRDPLYIPSAMICGKPSINWKVSLP